jgi:hypothetical protein
MSVEKLTDGDHPANARLRDALSKATRDYVDDRSTRYFLDRKGRLHSVQPWGLIAWAKAYISSTNPEISARGEGDRASEAQAMITGRQE